jgi:hypothetical protein
MADGPKTGSVANYRLITRLRIFVRCQKVAGDSWQGVSV